MTLDPATTELRSYVAKDISSLDTSTEGVEFTKVGNGTAHVDFPMRFSFNNDGTMTLDLRTCVKVGGEILFLTDHKLRGVKEKAKSKVSANSIITYLGSWVSSDDNLIAAVTGGAGSFGPLSSNPSNSPSGFSFSYSGKCSVAHYGSSYNLEGSTPALTLVIDGKFIFPQPKNPEHIQTLVNTIAAHISNGAVTMFQDPNPLIAALKGKEGKDMHDIVEQEGAEGRSGHDGYSNTELGGRPERAAEWTAESWGIYEDATRSRKRAALGG